MAGERYVDSLMKGKKRQETGVSDAAEPLIEHPDSFPVNELAGKLEEARQGFVGRDTDEAALLLNLWLLWSQSGERDAGLRWSYLTGEEGLDRDQEVLALWKQAKGNDTLKQEVKKKTVWKHYETHFFGWFLGRFNLPAARAVYVDHWLARRLHALWAVLAIAVTGTALALTRDFDLLTFVLAGFVVVVSLFAWVRKDKLPVYAYFHSLIPRLGAAIGIGYLFLLSAPHLVKLLEESWRPEWHFWIAGGVLLVAAFFYIAFHISRRVHPWLRLPTVVRRSWSIFLLGVGYSALELLVLAPVLFSPDLVCGAPDCAVNASPGRLALCAAIALNLGVILQLAWDEKPLTEPL